MERIAMCQVEKKIPQFQSFQIQGQARKMNDNFLLNIYLIYQIYILFFCQELEENKNQAILHYFLRYQKIYYIKQLSLISRFAHAFDETLNNILYNFYNKMSSQESSSEESTSIEKRKIRRIPVMEGVMKVKPKYKEIVMNLSMTKYDVISDVADDLGWRTQYHSKRGDWDVLWTDQMVQPETLIKMHFFQKVSHFPGIHVLARKNLLGLSFMEMSKKFPEDYNFFPQTWMLPNDFPEFRQDVQRNPKKCYIVKPEADCQGRGIFLTFKTDNVENGRHYVVQQYIEKPFLVDGLKFDFRVYVLLCGTNPMRLYMYEEGLARFATERYENPNSKNLGKMFMHLTNYAINKKNPKYIYNSSVKKMDFGHKRSLTSVFRYIERRGLNVGSLKKKLYDVIVKTVILGQPLVSHQYKFCQPDDQNRNMCFHILGIDVMIDELLNPIVIEVNHTPSFATDTPLDYKIKYSLIKDTLLLLNINEKTKKQLVKKTNTYERERITNVKKLIQNEEQKEKVREAQIKRDEYEKLNQGNYTKIYPVDDEEQMKTYSEYLKMAEKTYFTDNNCIRAQIEQAEKQRVKSPSKTKIMRKSSIQTPPKIAFQKDSSSEDLKDKLKNSSAQIARQQGKVSALLQNPLASHGSSFTKKSSKNNFSSSQYPKNAKSISQFDIQECLSPPDNSNNQCNRLNLIKNLPKIEGSLNKLKSSTIQIQKTTYIGLRKKKNIEIQPEKLNGRSRKNFIIHQESSRQQKMGQYIVPKVMHFNNKNQMNSHKKKTQKNEQKIIMKNSAIGRGFLVF